MRELVFCEAQNRGNLGLIAGLARRWRNRRVRSDLKLLQAMDAHALKDIGLSHADIERLLGLSRHADLKWEAERVRLRR